MMELTNFYVDLLYRVSTKQQGRQEDKDEFDIPVQRNACRAFVERMGWKIHEEYTELGVSGFKVSEAKRDKIQLIKKNAQRGKIQGVVVFMCDRLGRRADETPFVVEWFVRNGIEVWSVKEGQQRIENHTDKLTNYIKYWQAEGESLKTSVRVTEAQEQMFAAGKWTGGQVPYGFKLVPNGKVGKKNKLMNDLVKDENTGRVVDLIFQLVIYKGYGVQRLSNYLNMIKIDPNKEWHPQSVRAIIKNPMYTGRLRRNGVLSEPNEAWRYISDDDFALAQHTMTSRIYRKYPHRRSKENEAVPEGQTKTSVYGASLLSGLIYCGHCGAKLTGSYSVHNNVSEVRHIPIYRCYNNGNMAKKCDGQAVYTARFVERAVVGAIRTYFDFFSEDVAAIWNVQVKNQLKNKTKAALREAQSRLDALKQQHDKLKEEVMKSLLGESNFEPSMIQGMLDEKAAQIKTVQGQVETLTEEQQMIDESVRVLSEQYKSISNWAEAFDEATNDEKKMILARMIERIEVRRHYQIKIKFFIALDDFREAIAKSEQEGYTIVIEDSYSGAESLG